MLSASRAELCFAAVFADMRLHPQSGVDQEGRLPVLPTHFASAVEVMPHGALNEARAERAGVLILALMAYA